MRGTGTTADRGIIMRTGEAFQTFRLVRRIVLDKTGTLTYGRPTVRAVHARDEDAVLALAAAAENPSEHPLARAIVAAAEDRGLPVVDVEAFASVTGFGVRATVADREVLVGQPEFLAGAGIDLAPVTAGIDQLHAAGFTVVAVAAASRVEGVIGLGDQVRPDAADAVARMRSAGMDPVLVTGGAPRPCALLIRTMQGWVIGVRRHG